MTAILRKNEKSPQFATEADLVERFIGALQAGRTTYGVVEVATEWDHRAGFVDVLARDATDKLIAFEAKLSDWRRAFRQAYRNTAYANKAYVLLPEATVHRAIRDRDEFEFRGVGLCSFDGTEVRVLIEATDQDPLLQWLRCRAHEYFDGLADDALIRHQRRRGRAVRTTSVQLQR